ncbi:MAG: adenosylcobinamide-GDP ribazoletransferase [Gemmobacter sp.]
MILHRASSDLAEAAALLTRLPVPDHAPRGAATAWAWPVVGALIGAVLGAVGWATQGAGLPAGVTAALLLGTQAMLTGALHEDGLSDTADGLYGGRDRARRLEIMKDSRVGSYGVLALILVTLVRWSALSTLVGTGALLPALIAAGALSRAPMAAVMAALPNARGTGLSHATGRPNRRTAALAAGLALALSLVLTGPTGLALAVGAALAAAWVALTARARIGGQTGDILGATQQLAEAAVLTLAATLLI